MRKSQYLEIYGLEIPFPEDILKFYDRDEVELQQGEKILKGKVEDIRFCEEGDLRITNLEKKTDFLAFEMKVAGEYMGPFNSYIKTPPRIDEDLNNWNKNHNK